MIKNRVLPILFNTNMVQAILDGRKTVTRRLIKPQPTYSERDGFLWKGVAYGTDGPQTIKAASYNFRHAAPYRPGNILYVCETWHKYTKRVGNGENCRLQDFYGYKASVANSEDANEKWHPSIHMPKEAARIWLMVTNVRVEHLQDITDAEAGKEGAQPQNPFDYDVNKWPNKEYFKEIWNSTLKKSDLERYGWEANPWVWVIEFERCNKPGGEL